MERIKISLELSPERGCASIVPSTGMLRTASMPGRPNMASNGLKRYNWRSIGNQMRTCNEKTFINLSTRG